MNIACPRCSRRLPEVENLKYRFCPHCGAEIAVDPEKHQNALLTIPPEPEPRRPEPRPENSHGDAQADKQPTLTERFKDHTIAPQPMAGRPQATLKPPDTPPPAGFFRRPSETIKPPAQDIYSQPPTKNRNKIIIAVLISLAVIILILGGLLTF